MSDDRTKAPAPASKRAEIDAFLEKVKSLAPATAATDSSSQETSPDSQGQESR